MSLTASYLQAGVGDGEDLRVFLSHDAARRWYPQITKGWYYLEGSEYYLFALAGTATASSAAGSGWHTGSFQADGTDVNVLEYDSVLQPVDPDYRRVCCPLRAFTEVPASGWTDLGNGLWSASGYAIILSVFTDPATGVLDPVAGTGEIVHDRQYYYDPASQLLYVRAATAPSGLFTNSIAHEATDSLLTQVEVLRVDSDGAVRTQYARIHPSSGAADPYRPTLWRVSAGSLLRVDPASVSGNVWTFSGTGAPVSGETVCAQYVVEKSFAVRDDGITVDWYSSAESSGFSVYYETVDRDHLDTSQEATGSASYVQLSPLESGVRSGFLYLTARAVDPVGQVAEITAVHYPQATFYSTHATSGSCGQPVRLLARAYDRLGERVVGAPLTLAVTGASGTPLGADLSSGEPVTNWRGEVAFLLTPTGTGTITYSIACSGSEAPAVTGSVAVVDRTATYLTRGEGFLDGTKLLLHLDGNRAAGGGGLLRAQLLHLDGPPALEVDHAGVTFHSRLGGLSGGDGFTLTVPLDPERLAAVAYTPRMGDEVYATALTARGTVVSPRLRL